MAKVHFFIDDHDRLIRIGVSRNGEVAVHLVDSDGDVIPLKASVAVVNRVSSIEKPLGLRKLREQAKKCPLSQIPD